MDVFQSPSNDGTDLQAERDAVRIQAAAVAAQQAQLTDEETHLNQRRAALEKREQQIAEHLEDRQKRLLALRDEIKQERGVLDEERRVFEERKVLLRGNLGRAQRQAERERRRLSEARKRFKQRWLRYTAEKQSGLRQHEQQVLAEQQRLQKEADALQRERAQFSDVRLRLNGEIEMSRRELKSGWEELGLAQQQWGEALNFEHQAREQRRRALEAREAAVAEGEQKLVVESRHFADVRARLLKEIEGLENRVRNQRYQLKEEREARGEERGAGGAGAIFPMPPSLSVAPQPPPLAPLSSPLTPFFSPLVPHPGILQDIAGHLADQRWLLLEHWSRFLQIQDEWQREQTALVADCEETSHSFEERERRNEEHELTLDNRESEARRYHESLAQTRAELECWHARLTLSETDRESEWTARLADVEERERTAAALVEQLEAVRQRSQERRRNEIEELREARRQCEEIRQESLTLIRRLQERQAELAEEHRSLAARTVAVERYRLECLNRSTNSPAAEKRLEKLRRRCHARIEAGEREVTAQRQTLLTEARRLEERARQLQQRENELTALKEAVAEQQSELEQRQIAQTETELPREQTLRRLKIQHDHDANQLAVLREEVERLARLLLEDGEAGVKQAA